MGLDGCRAVDLPAMRMDSHDHRGEPALPAVRLSGRDVTEEGHTCPRSALGVVGLLAGELEALPFLSGSRG